MFMAICVLVVLIHISTQTTPHRASAKLRDAYDHDMQRMQRSMFGIATDAINGFRAKTKLLKGTTLDRSELKLNQIVFNKKGSYSNAIDDFKSVGPRNVIEYTLPGGSKGMTGTIGDRTIMIRKSALDNTGSLRIFRERGKNYVIRYQE